MKQIRPKMTFLVEYLGATQCSLISNIFRLLSDLKSVGKGIDDSDKKESHPFWCSETVYVINMDKWTNIFTYLMGVLSFFNNGSVWNKKKLDLVFSFE